MKIKSAEFLTSAVKPSQYPAGNLPEIAFAGRSNVGKSSLINVLVNRKHLVKTSATPGRTQLINFFLINATYLFVDLPGYGYAKVPVHIRRKWGPMVETYLSSRANLRAVVLIMDIRRHPRREETDLINWLHYFAIPPVLVLTKADKLSKTKQRRQQDAVAAELGIAFENLILFSAKSRLGREAVWQAIQACLSPEPPGQAGM